MQKVIHQSWSAVADGGAGALPAAIALDFSGVFTQGTFEATAFAGRIHYDPDTAPSEHRTELAACYPEVRVFSLGAPNYGRALRRGILEARGEIVICEEIDLCDTTFHANAVRIIEAGAADFVIGSKLLRSSSDERPMSRHAASIVYNGLLKTLVGFRGTDTHGLKAFRRAAVLPIVEACLVDKDVFASELVIRADRAGVSIREIPVRVMEKRPPSVGLMRRVPAVVKQLAKLTWSIRGGARLGRADD